MGLFLRSLVLQIEFIQFWNIHCLQQSEAMNIIFKILPLSFLLFLFLSDILNNQIFHNGFYQALIIFIMSHTHRIKVYRALLKRDLRSLSDMIPYAQIQIGNITKNTMPSEKGGKKPSWNQVLQFKTQLNDAKITIFDSGNFGDQIVASGNFDISSIQSTSQQTVIDLYHEAKVVGKIFLRVLSKQIAEEPNKNKMQELIPKPESDQQAFVQTPKKIFGSAANILLNNNSNNNRSNSIDVQKQNLNTPRSNSVQPPVPPAALVNAFNNKFSPPHPQGFVPPFLPTNNPASFHPPFQPSFQPPYHNPLIYRPPPPSTNIIYGQPQHIKVMKNPNHTNIRNGGQTNNQNLISQLDKHLNNFGLRLF